MSDSGSSQRHPFDPKYPGADGSSSMQTHLGPDPFIVGDEPTVISQGPPRLLPQLRPGTHPTELGRLLEGERLGHFDLEEFIGGGGMGAVFRALDTMLNRIVAVKVLSSEQSTDEDTQRRFKNEAQSAARLDHENIARVYYVGEDRGVHYIVFEYIEGINIRDLVTRDGPLPIADAISFTWQIAQALNHASQRDVVHRDIKPSNVLITPNGRAKLVDMGLARLHQVEHTENDLTASGVTLGTFDYISPEQARDPRTADVRSDLYSLGCTMYYMLTGRPPFPDGTVLQKLLRHQGDEPPNPREFRAEVPEEIAAVTCQLLAKQPDARFQTPDELIARLLTVCETLEIPISESLRPASLVPEPSKQTVPVRKPSKIRSHLPWLVPLVLLLTATIFIDRYTSSSSKEITFQNPNIRALPVDSRSSDADEGIESESGDSTESSPFSSESTDSPGNNFDNKTENPISSAEGPDAQSDTKQQTGSTESSKSAEATSDLPGSNSTVRPDALNPEGTAGEQAGNKTAATTPPGKESDPADQTKSGERASASDTEKMASASTNKSPMPATFIESSPSQGSPTNPDEGPMGPLIVDPAGTVGTYGTLEAACAVARSGDVIELHHDGVLPIRPFKLTNLTLTIRAARGKHPRLLFRPSALDKSPELYPRSMITVTGGDLTLVGLQLELELPREVPSEHWSLFEVRGVQSLGMEQCVLTVRNATEGGGAYHQRVSMIEVAPAPGDAMMRDAPVVGTGPAKLRPVNIRLLNCIARGEAVMLLSAQMEHVDFSWQNGLAALSETMIETSASQSAMRENSRVQINLQHVTAVLRRGLLLLTNSDDAPYPMEADITCKDSIFMVGSDAGLIEQRCVHPATSLQEMIVWTGERNFFEGFTTFWKIRVMGLSEQSQLAPLMFDTWRSYWQQRPEGYAIQSQLGAVIWKHLPASSLPLHAQSPANYLLGEGVAGNPAKGAAKNGQDVGFHVDLLPPLMDQATVGLVP